MMMDLWDSVILYLRTLGMTTFCLRFSPPSFLPIRLNVLPPASQLYSHPTQNISPHSKSHYLFSSKQITTLCLSLFTEMLSFASVTPLLQSARSDHAVVSLFFLSFLPASYLGIVTPLFNVRLEDVLDRKHLPPLGKPYCF